MINFLRRRFREVRGLNTVPGVIALLLWSLSIVCLWIDHRFPEFATSQPFRLFFTDYDTAKSVLSTVAAASITTLGLVYSIVLVVFTTAAGNIGPRLLQRFTTDRANQFTAGLFGGTFLFALTVLHQTDSSFVPAFSIAATFLLAGLSVLQLIYFVHSASVSVTIDEEVAEIADQLEKDLTRLLDAEDLDRYRSSIPNSSDTIAGIKSHQSGYVTFIDHKALIEVAKELEGFILLKFGQGDFVVPGLEIARLTNLPDDRNWEEIAKSVRTAIGISSSRSPNSDVEFSINLLIEIALRALSPGVNDTYTAVTCVDRISSALVRPVAEGLRDQIRSDEDRVPRFHLPGMSLRDIINTTFHPVRRAASGNILMTRHILDALERLYILGNDDAREILLEHADLVVEGAEAAGLLAVDRDFISQRRSRFDSL